ncbi:MAG: hypothetical protein LUC27_09425 [Lachnospiraceae bacterium]|nr:hypothetical protein [Lachnospiraceae bacterium]
MAVKRSWKEAIARSSLVSPRLDRRLLNLQRSFLEASGVLEQLDEKGGRRNKDC